MAFGLLLYYHIVVEAHVLCALNNDAQVLGQKISKFYTYILDVTPRNYLQLVNTITKLFTNRITNFISSWNLCSAKLKEEANPT